ncbi:unnamed protein product [Adineta ricciae]|uniref:GH26 domain-containing protein n=1 Tax=Adineta ricciae TaxID=249248 RepID=A0A815KPX5_ADIRI|nr:unnamed protein product [Adineta ricciae]CAF1398671.1 unnamed protein product [Adineta ricciae]
MPHTYADGNNNEMFVTMNDADLDTESNGLKTVNSVLKDGSDLLGAPARFINNIQKDWLTTVILICILCLYCIIQHHCSNKTRRRTAPSEAYRVNRHSDAVIENMHLRKGSIFLFLSILLRTCIGQQTADKQADVTTKQVLQYITNLSKQGKYLSGQYIGISKPNMSMSLITNITAEAGQVPGIFECDYANGFWSTTPPQKLLDHSCNSILKDNWNKGGLINICAHFPNPVSPNGGELRNKSNLEANGAWFWWGRQDPTLFKNVWIHMFNYLTQVKDLHNILWIYSPDQGAPTPSLYYPGSAYVDIVGLDVYTDEPVNKLFPFENSLKGYDEMLALNKPMILGEVGPRTTDGQFDFSLWPTAIRNKYPKVSYLLTWAGPWSPVANRNAYNLFNNAYVINRGGINITDTMFFV